MEISKDNHYIFDMSDIERAIGNIENKNVYNNGVLYDSFLEIHKKFCKTNELEFRNEDFDYAYELVEDTIKNKGVVLPVNQSKFDVNKFFANLEYEDIYKHVINNRLYQKENFSFYDFYVNVALDMKSENKNGVLKVEGIAVSDKEKPFNSHYIDLNGVITMPISALEFVTAPATVTSKIKQTVSQITNDIIPEKNISDKLTAEDISFNVNSAFEYIESFLTEKGKFQIEEENNGDRIKVTIEVNDKKTGSVFELWDDEKYSNFIYSVLDVMDKCPENRNDFLKMLKKQLPHNHIYDMVNGEILADENKFNKTLKELDNISVQKNRQNSFIR